jgi:hypothetical protein
MQRVIQRPAQSLPKQRNRQFETSRSRRLRFHRDPAQAPHGAGLIKQTHLEVGRAEIDAKQEGHVREGPAQLVS